MYRRGAPPFSPGAGCPPRPAPGNDRYGNGHSDNGIHNRTFPAHVEPDISTLR